MRKQFFVFLLTAIIGLSVFSIVEAAVRVGGYYRSTGTYVQPYYRSSPNSYRYDNYSSYGNYNPYTGKKGYTKYYWSW